MSDKTIKNSMLYVIQVVIASLLPLISIPIVTHKLSPSEFGVFALAQVYASVAAGIMNWGASAGYERNFFLHDPGGRESGALLASVLAFVFVNIFVLVVIVFYWRDSLSLMLFESASYGSLLVIVLMGVSLSTMANYYLIYLKNSSLAVDFVKITILQSVVNFLLIIFFLLFQNAGINSLAYALFLSNLLLFVITLVRQIVTLPISFSKKLLIDVLRISLPLTPRVLFGFLNTHFDKMMLGMMASVGGVGIYSIGQKVSLVVFQFMTALDRVFIPEVYRRLFAQEEDSREPEIGKYLTPFAYVSIFVALMVVLLSEELVTLLLPPSYGEATNVIIILSVFYSSMFFGKITGTQLIFAKKTYLSTVLTLVGILINVSLNIPMIKLWGLLGAAWATLFSGIIMTIISYYVAQRYARVYWEWRSLIGIGVIFFFAVGFMLINQMGLLGLSYGLVIFIKVLLIMVYLYWGNKLGIITIDKIRTVYNVLISMIGGKSTVK